MEGMAHTTVGTGKSIESQVCRVGRLAGRPGKVGVAAESERRLLPPGGSCLFPKAFT